MVPQYRVGVAPASPGCRPCVPWVATLGRRTRRIAERLAAMTFAPEPARLGSAHSWAYQKHSLTVTDTMLDEHQVHLTAVCIDHQLAHV